MYRSNASTKKSSWHIYNLKRRIASLPPIELIVFEKIAAANAASSHEVINTQSSEDEESSGAEIEHDASPFQCLFCSLHFADDDGGLDQNIRHMQAAHGMFIPDVDQLLDLQTFVAYLATEVRIWHECLYCGATKPSPASVQSHMRDTGHCQLNFEREPELLEFWDATSDLHATSSSSNDQRHHSIAINEGELHLSSGKTIASKARAHVIKKGDRRRISPDAPTTRALAEAPEASDTGPAADDSAQPTHKFGSRQLARRDDMSIQGITPQQRQALVLAEKKAQRSEAVARRAREWVLARRSNTQDFDQMDTTKMGKRGKQTHKLLPR